MADPTMASRYHSWACAESMRLAERGGGMEDSRNRTGWCRHTKNSPHTESPVNHSAGREPSPTRRPHEYWMLGVIPPVSHVETREELSFGHQIEFMLTDTLPQSPMRLPPPFLDQDQPSRIPNEALQGKEKWRESAPAEEIRRWHLTFIFWFGTTPDCVTSELQAGRCRCKWRIIQCCLQSPF